MTPRHPVGRRSGIRRHRFAVLLVLALVAATGCATGRDAVVSGGEFTFVAPGGQTRIFYDPPSARGAPGPMSGDSLTEPGRAIDLADFAGQVVVINIWGSWCGPCRAEADDLRQLYESNRAAGMTVLGIDIRDSRDAATDFVRDRGVSYPSLFDPPGRSLDALRGYPRNAVPSTIVLDRQHRVAAVFLAAIRIGELAPVVARLTAEPAG